jgi:hypothetical protein
MQLIELAALTAQEIVEVSGILSLQKTERASLPFGRAEATGENS